MLFKKLLLIDLSGLPKNSNISWQSIKNKLEYLLNTRNKIYSARSSNYWENLINANESARDHHFKSLINYAREEEQLRLSIANSLSICRNKGIMPDNIANFINLQDNFSKLLGCDNAHISNILLYIEWLVEAMSLIEKRVLSEINDKNQQKELITEAEALVSDIKKYSSVVCDNILIRLEIIAKYGFVDNLGMMAVFDTYNQSFDVNDLKISIWNKDEFERYYFFILKNGNVNQIERLKDLEFDFGKIYINSDNSIAAYPKIYEEGELLLERPWLSWLRRGANTRYTLFKDGSLQVELNAKLKLAEKLNDESSIAAAIEALTAEYIRVSNIKKGLPKYIYPKENELCDRWQKYLASKMYDIKSSGLLKLSNIISSNYDVVELMLDRGSLLSYMKTLKLVRPLSDITLIDLHGKIHDKFFKIIISLIINVLMRDNLQGKKYMIALENLFSEDILPYIIGSERYDDAYFLFMNLKGVSDAEKLFAVIKKYTANGDYDSVLQKYFNVNVVNNKSTILMQSYINRCFASGKDIQSFSSTALSYTNDFNIADEYYKNVESILRYNHKSSDEFLKKLFDALLGCKNTIINYRLCIEIKNQLDNKIKHCSYNPRYLDMVLEYGSSPIRHRYCLGIFNAKIKSGASLHNSLIECNYYNIVKYDSELACQIRPDIQGKLVEMLTTYYAGATLSQFKSLFAGITKDNSIMQDFDINHQAYIDSFIIMKFINTWSSSARYIISLFASDTVRNKYHIKLINTLSLNSSYNDEMHDALSYIKELNEDSSYYWSCFGLLDHNIKDVIDNVSSAIKNIGYTDDRVDFLDFVFSNDSLVKFYKISELKDSWVKKKLSIVKQKELGLLFKYAKDKCFDSLLKAVELIDIHRADIRHIEPAISNMLHLIWGDFEKIIKASLFTDNLDELLIYKTKVIDKLLSGPLVFEQSCELKFLSWLATIGPFIKTSNLIFVELSQEVTNINPLILYLYNIKHYYKGHSNNINKNMAQYSKYNSKSGIAKFFYENISLYQDYTDPNIVNEVTYDIPEAVLAPCENFENEYAQANPVNIATCMPVSELDSDSSDNDLLLSQLDVFKNTDSNRENADIDILNYMLEYGLSAEVRVEALFRLNEIDSLATDRDSISRTPGFFSN